ncbi:MAG: tRNA 2-thiouridine(34) synthase MnmA [Deltaproteobacteria bacterium]|mgnify:CR=1 FL=1|nr:tRNA 2-thiouridine(34) synthase MnmA [Deltaproteobacteria bacterium]MBW2074290.1 tRNA 2-thiouridine(34) synthase MnmA [Deltaproteobacteria bacterium]
MKTTVAVALSGGLDSAVAAALLKKKSYRVIGLYFQTGYELPPGDSTPPRPLSRIHTRAQMAAKQIGIPLEVLDCSQPFEREVVRYFIDTYRSGKTPNPCVVCNQCIKFGFILDRAMALGVSALATGHYARIRQEPNGRFCLLKGVDRAKDQSYFLARLSQKQLSRVLFPLGTYTKKQVREMAEAWGFGTFMDSESQELCFVRHPSYKDFLSSLAEVPPKPGPIVNTRGDIIGHHQGLHAYTVGQRRGIGIPGPEPYYVIRLDNKQNRLVIGSKSELAATECRVTDINWIETKVPDKPISVQTRIRYRHQEAASTLTPLGPSTATVRFSEAQYAITPGQAAVFYKGERVLGGGWIA